ncbi:MAG: bifunctional molybdenum cofactor guanylyltransferase MobA/molybdopterin-guanine dinucleotide biosynthesis adaptor protein MobB [Geobacter sp.]|nr:bifunctional molybdenum cofactor guanylyltransferase MobA/molybdopterin-guanine dinucleotide biosynthesis adaptor protein MobB [Geobacter sp.]
METAKIDDITGIILVGGQSRRMGRDKALLRVGGSPLYARVLETFASAFKRVILVGDRPERFGDRNIAIVPDLYPGSALGGLYTGLYHAETERVFVAPCDIPFPNEGIIRHLCRISAGYDAVVPETGQGMEPLFAVYAKSCLGPMKELLDEDNFRIYDFYPKVRMKYVPNEELQRLDPDGTAFLNLNTPDDILRMEQGETMTVKALSFVAKSGTGKTTLLEKVISELKGRGYRIGAIKHDAHRFDIDHPGKDSHRLAAAGADTMLISSPEKLALVKKHAEAPPIEELLATYFGDVDIVLTEGFKKSGLPKIELHRKERSPTLICRGEEHDPSLIAVASDEPLELDVPVLDLNDPSAVADFVEKRFLR